MPRYRVHVEVLVDAGSPEEGLVVVGEAIGYGIANVDAIPEARLAKSAVELVPSKPQPLVS